MSDQYDPIPFVDDDGIYRGWQYPVEGGGAVIVSDDGQVVAAADDAGNALDPAEFELIPGQDVATAEDPRYAELSEGLDRIEQRMNEANERSRNQMFVPAAQTEEAALAAMVHDAGDLETALGRPLTDREKRELATRAIDTAAATGEPVSLLGAANELDSLGTSPIHDLSSHEGRSRYMFERAKEADPASAPDAVTGQEQRRQETYNMAEHADRVAFAMDKLNGHDVEGREQAPDREEFE